MKLEFCRHIFEESQILVSSYIKIRTVAAELFHANGQTKMTKLIVAFRNFANKPKKHLK